MDLLNSPQKYMIACVYRPPPSAVNKLTENQFLDEFAEYLASVATASGHLRIVGDFNFHLENTDKSQKFRNLLQKFNLVQHISQPTHKDNGILDLVITRISDNCVSDVSFSIPLESDHFSVQFKIISTITTPTKKTVSYRNLKSIDVEKFKADSQN